MATEPFAELFDEHILEISAEHGFTLADGAFDPDKFFLHLTGAIEEDREGGMDHKGDLSLLFAVNADQMSREERISLEKKLSWQIEEMGRKDDPDIIKMYALVLAVNRNLVGES